MLKHLKQSDEWSEMTVGQKGFTLIELLVVIIILGILAAVVVFAVGGIQDKAQTNSCKTEFKTLKTAVEAYKADNSGNPATAANLYSGTTKYIESAPSWYTVTAGVVNVPTSGPCNGIST